MNSVQNWRQRATLKGVPLKTLQAAVKDIYSKRMSITARNLALRRKLHLLDSKIKGLVKKEERYLLAIGSRRSSKCPCFKHFQRGSSCAEYTICLAKPKNWDNLFMLRDTNYMILNCGRCKLSKKEREAKAMMALVSGYWKKITQGGRLT